MIAARVTRMYWAARERFVKDEGATAVEYGLIVGLIAAAIIGVVVILGQNLSGLFGDIGTAVGNARP